MSIEPSAVDAFLAQVAEPARGRLARFEGLSAALLSMLTAARAPWPEVHLDAVTFLRYLAQRVPAEGDAVQGLAQLNSEDLYVACASAQGDPAAIRALEGRCFREIDTALRRLRADAALVEDVKQVMRQELFVQRGEAAPAICGYSGRGQLRRWLRVIAVRTCHRLTRRDRDEVGLEEDLLSVLPAPGEDPALQHMKDRYREAFAAAFAEAMAALPEGDRLLLKQHFVDGLNIDEIAALHGAHRATAARWLARVRAAIAEKTRELLLKNSGVAGGDYESILRLIQSQLDLSIRGHLVR